MHSADATLLKQIPLFSELSEAEITELANLLKERVFTETQPIFWIGDEGTDFFVIQHGQVSLSFPDEAGNEEELRLGPGSFFGEISLLDGGPRTATARAATQLTLLSLGREDFLNYIRIKPSVGIHIMTVLGKRTRGMLDKLRGVKNVNEAVAQSTTKFERIADRVTSWMASPLFIAFQFVFCAAWVMTNELEKTGGHTPFDAYPFGLLSLIVSGQALILTSFILIAQGRQNHRDRIRADLDYQVNLKAHLEVVNLHKKVDQLQQLVHAQRLPQHQSPANQIPGAEHQPLGEISPAQSR